MREQHGSLTLLEQPASSNVVCQLYRKGLLNEQGRVAALDLLLPPNQWGYWTDKFLLVLGWICIFSSILLYISLYFQHYQWGLGSILILILLGLAWLLRVSLQEKQQEISMSTQALLDWLELKGLLPHKEFAQAYLLCEANIDPRPFYWQALLHLAAFLISGFVFIVLYLFEVFDALNNEALTLLGFLILSAAIGVYHVFKNSDEWVYHFSLSIASNLSIIGKILFVAGFSHILQEHLPRMGLSWSYTLSIFLILIPTYYLFTTVFDRFISTLAFFLSMLLSAMIEFPHHIFFYIYVICLFALVGTLFNSKVKNVDTDPIAFAGLAALAGVAFTITNYPTHLPIILFNLTFSVAILCLIILVSKFKQPLNHLGFICGCIAIILLGIISTSGIVFSIGLLILSYSKHYRSLLLCGILLLLLFLINYYYHLPTDPTYDAAILAGSGILLLISHFVIQHEKWNRA